MAEQTMIEAPESEKTTEGVVETKVEEKEQSPVEETKTQEVKQEETKEEAKEEPSIEFEGQRYTATQLKEMQDALNNKKEWTKANTQRAQEIAAERKRLERLSLLEEAIQKRPEVLQELFKPQAQRNIDSELQALYQKKPVDVFSTDYAQWEMQKDQLIAERSTQRATELAESRIMDREAREHNERIGAEAEAKFREKGYDDLKIQEIGRWVVETVKPKNGKYDAKAFDYAERVLFGDEAARQAKLEAAKSTAQAITRAKPASTGSGLNKRTEPTTPEDEADDAFVQAIQERAGR